MCGTGSRGFHGSISPAHPEQPPVSFLPHAASSPSCRRGAEPHCSTEPDPAGKPSGGCGEGRKAPYGSALPTAPLLRLTGGSCRCAGKLEVYTERGWIPVCGDMKKHEAASICQQLSCGPLSATGYLAMDSNREARVQAMRCTWMGTWERCHWLPANCSNHATFICSGEHHATLPAPLCPHCLYLLPPFSFQSQHPPPPSLLLRHRPPARSPLVRAPLPARRGRALRGCWGIWGAQIPPAMAAISPFLLQAPPGCGWWTATSAAQASWSSTCGGAGGPWRAARATGWSWVPASAARLAAAASSMAPRPRSPASSS